jgi:nucleotide-binding universal stress UspA family protein
MNDILVGIDFSDCSINALEHAISFARKAEKDIIMVWVNRHESQKELLTYSSDNIIEEVKKRFEKLISNYKPDFKQEMKFEIRDGKIYKQIVKTAEEYDVSLIVVGTHGASGFEEFWIGSNANKIISFTHIPVVTIRSKIDIERDLQRIVLPIDSTPETRQKIIFTAVLAAYFKAEVHVLALYSVSSKTVHDRVDKYAKQMTDYLEEEGIKYKLISQRTDNITNSTIEYAKSIDANLIAIMTEQEHSTSNILLGSYALQMVNNSSIPVLSIHPKDLLSSI